MYSTQKNTSPLFEEAVKTVWCVDDEDTIREIEVYTLEQMGFEARGFSDGITMLSALETEQPDLIILDLMMPEVDGLAVLEKIREIPGKQEIAVIIATAKGNEIDKITGLNAGADDYMVKPFGMMEMVARVNAVLRRTDKGKSFENLAGSKIQLLEDAYLAIVDGKKVSLTAKEVAILRLFMRHPGAVFSRDVILSEAWEKHYTGENRVVDMQIKNLRKKLGTAGSRIKTVIGVGYKMEIE